jgi:hypothetical protein
LATDQELAELLAPHVAAIEKALPYDPAALTITVCIRTPDKTFVIGDDNQVIDWVSARFIDPREVREAFIAKPTEN